MVSNPWPPMAVSENRLYTIYGHQMIRQNHVFNRIFFSECLTLSDKPLQIMVSCTYVVVFWTLMDLKIIQDWLMSGTRRGVPPLREGREVGGAVRLKQQMRCDQWLPTMGLTTFPSN